MSARPYRRETWLPYGRQWIDERDIEAVTAVLRGDYLTTGPLVPEFESKFARAVGAAYAVAFSNGTAALHGACQAAGIGPGDEAVTTPMTFAASANAVLYLGGKPVFADIDPRTYNLDPTAVEPLLNERTKAIVTVDFTGQPSRLSALKAMAEARGIPLIEDAAHALGASYRGRPVGSAADMTMFSLHPVKHVTAGEGGVIATNDERYYRKLTDFRNHGIVRDRARLEAKDAPAWYYEMQSLGFNYRLTDFQAALADSQLDKLDRFVARRRAIARRYDEAFGGLDEVVTPYQDGEGESSWHLYVLQLNLEQLRAGRDEVFERLHRENVGANLHYIPVYLHPYYRDLGYARGLCPNAEWLYERILTLPLFPAMTDEDVDDVIRAVRSVIRACVPETSAR
ncbi:UDP-4-amino-4,6-dideoxy-N-acetyl-beta-L-altrosamine transaminase [Cohnella nanjingensis]|uniref:UDP-4-amino-4, 6-dideoxy-N-acetyl-beta-L-altrosamine transaminase n=1 Tax=Cohnella nanjingensis TaxID=1387779 RepID=A0A7X0VF52_9BACL|nr:UDP-4-amino-4,6-dideoxy-N-acetyl-beta-L-altrosamine transaminase [Cohnella nanjingensis]MBB6671695.1 UDP-4-amino-4,6-dideoxy-N-acetyl-beta-L-altrosamine transaminase [Cohnella nanjingensis]